MLEKLADYYDEEVEMTTQSVLAAMEPLINCIYGAGCWYTGYRGYFTDWGYV